MLEPASKSNCGLQCILFRLEGTSIVFLEVLWRITTAWFLGVAINNWRVVDLLVVSDGDMEGISIATTTFSSLFQEGIRVGHLEDQVVGLSGSRERAQESV